MPPPRKFRHVKKGSRFHIGDVRCLLKRRDRALAFEATRMYEAFRIDLSDEGAARCKEFPAGSYLVKNHIADKDAVWVFPEGENREPLEPGQAVDPRARKAFKPRWFGLEVDEVAKFPKTWAVKAEKIWMEY